MAKRLWDKGEELDNEVHSFTVDSDPVIDLEFIRWDCIGSAAHARMLEKLGVLEVKDVKNLISGLKEIFEKSEDGEFDIPIELEDGHTAIESYLVDKLGETGKRIHAGRSRNDQVATATRLYLRHHLVCLMQELVVLAATMSKRFDEVGTVPLPGYTHLQKAMPSSVGMWLHAFVEGVLDLLRAGKHLLDQVDSNPLGSAAGFGSSLPLDCKFTAEQLGFSRVQRSPIDVQNSRGRYELRLLRWGSDLSTLIEKIAWDMQLFVTEGFGFFTLPVGLTTGSSIMPQKRNPDVLELLRARASRMRGSAHELEWIIAKLPSNYHRDFQLTKEPVVRSVQDMYACISMATKVIGSFAIKVEQLKEAMSAELYATYEAYREVSKGAAFRDAYKNTAEKVSSGKLDVQSLQTDFEGIWRRILSSMDEAKFELKQFSDKLEGESKRLEELEVKVLKP